MFLQVSENELALFAHTTIFAAVEMCFVLIWEIKFAIVSLGLLSQLL